jgi:hypothetical protein
LQKTEKKWYWHWPGCGNGLQVQVRYSAVADTDMYIKELNLER